MIDRLAIINQRVKESEKDIAEVARILKLDRKTIYNWLADPELSKEKIALLGYATGYNFSKDFADLKGYYFNFEDKQYIVGEPLPVYGNTSKEDIAELKNEVNYLRQKLQTVDTKMDILQDTLNRVIKGMN